MDIGKSFTYVFEDPNWIVKVLIGGIVSVIPIVNFAVVGYMLTTLRNVAEGQPTPLPEWGDFGNHFMKGLYAVVGGIVYFLPAIVVYCCIILLTSLLPGSAGTVSGRNAANNVGGIVGLVVTCLGCLVGLYSLVAGLTIYAPLTRFAMSANQLSVFWDLRGNFDFITRNLSNYIIAILIALVASFVASLGLILCVVGVIFTEFWSSMVTANIFGQLWRQSEGVGGVSPAMAAPPMA